MKKVGDRRVIMEAEEENFDLDALAMNASSQTSSKKFVRNQRDTELVKVLKSDGTFVDNNDPQEIPHSASYTYADGSRSFRNKYRSSATFNMLELKKMFVRTDLQPEAGVSVNASSSGACCDDFHTYLHHGRRYILPSAVEAKEPKHFNGGVGMVSLRASVTYSFMLRSNLLNW